MIGPANGHRVGVDVGGSFTDVFAFDGKTGRFDIAKVASTPGAQADGFMSGIDASGAEDRPEEPIERDVSRGYLTREQARVYRRGNEE